MQYRALIAIYCKAENNMCHQLLGNVDLDSDEIGKGCTTVPQNCQWADVKGWWKSRNWLS